MRSVRAEWSAWCRGRRAAMLTTLLVAALAAASGGASLQAAQDPTAPPPAAGPAVFLLGVPEGAVDVQGGVPRQRGVRPPRDPRGEPAPDVGTGLIRGRVIDAATGQPLARARVRLAIRDGKTTQTGPDGTFTFTQVPAGQINLMAEKASYLPGQFPERRRTLRSRGFTLAEGQKLEDVTVPMYRGGAIVGRVVDPYGDPVEHVNLQAFLLPSRPGGAPAVGRMHMRGGQSSNDIGEFRVGNLEPGTYILLAMPQRRPDEPGSALGRTFYPGVPSPEQAQTITLERGQTTSVEITLAETGLTKVTGVVVNSKGEPVTGGGISARQQMTQSFGAGNRMIPFDGTGTGIRPDGSFEITLPPGDYIFEAMPAPREAWSPDRGSPDKGSPDKEPREVERGVARLTVGGEPMAGVTIATGGGATVSGRVVFDGTGPPPDPRRIFIAFGGGPNHECRAGRRPTVNPDGTFTADNLWGTCTVQASGGGWQLKSVLHAGTDLTTRPITLDAGRRVSDLQVVFTNRLGDLALDVTDDRGGALAEYVALVFPVNEERWEEGRYVRTYMPGISGGISGVAVGTFSFGISGSGGSGRVIGGTSGVGDGTMKTGMVPGAAGPGAQAPPGGSGPPLVRGLLAGEYFVVVLDDVGYEDIRDAAFLAQVAPLATRVSLAEGETKSVTLRRVALPDAPQ